MKKIIAVFLVFVGIMVNVVPVTVRAEDPCSGCWWNDVDRDCYENGIMCCGSCQPGSPIQ